MCFVPTFSSYTRRSGDPYTIKRAEARMSRRERRGRWTITERATSGSVVADVGVVGVKVGPGESVVVAVGAMAATV